MRGLLALSTAVVVFFIALIFTKDFIHLFLIYWVAVCFSYMAWDSWINYLKTEKKTETCTSK
ncbi:hypothetical protein [Staphylococcus equorum]|uniref:hypothetical protein n=1 Tax=Staphylococcus equorum TaxID=246432 RepID=UPI0021BF15B1|nr:hypothetical protein [Staphylococcus equorum]MDK9853170.1 hypothetical protein [Staphylococcus equorum]MDK9857599.1 hypothetical protein [Staphylococcus equorum]MDK9874660.1 hypothetical protein [Staphylococcus equorum]